MNSCNVADGECMAQAHDSAQRKMCASEHAACTDGCSGAKLTVTKQIVPAIDAGRFDLLIDGIVRKQGVGNGGMTGPIALPPGAHSVSEAAVGGGSLGNYTTTFGGDCDPTGHITLSLGDDATCEITNTRKPGTGAEAHLTVKKEMVPAIDPGRFDLRIDGAVNATNVGNGGTTGAVTVLEGVHTVSETGSGTNVSNYIRSFSGDCDASGTVTLVAGDNKTCTITNRKNTAPCVAACNIAEQQCMSGAHSSGQRQACIRERLDCVKECNQ